jgi:predicted enzyme related to lactoylglutathione lyase
MIKDIAFIAYPSNDVAGTRAWYEEMLGLRFAGPYAEEGIEKYNEAHFGSGCFSLMASEWVGREPGSAAGVVFEVDDIDNAAGSLRDKGVIVEAIEDMPACRLTSFSDPEGNKVSLHQKKVSH